MRNMGTFAKKRHFLTAGMVFLLLILAACGTNTSTLTGSSNASATATEPPIQHCGAVHTLGLHIVPIDQQGAKSAVDCFWQAYQQCHPATLIYSQGGVDAATIHTFSLKSQNGKCVITDTLQHVVLPHTPTPGESDTCTGLTQQTDGLHFQSCNNEGNVVVPEGA